MSNECRADCPCKAQSAEEAARRVARMVGGNVEAALALLRAHGWVLVKR